MGNSIWKSFSNINWTTIRPGDTIYVSGGNTSRIYTQTLTVGKSGSAGNSITISREVDLEHNGVPIIDGQNSRRYGVVLESRKNVTVAGLSLRNHTSAGFRIRFANFGVLVEDNDIHTGRGRGIDVRSNTGGVRVKGNRVRIPSSSTSQTDGIYSQGNSEVTYERNDVDITNTDNTGHSDAFQSHLDNSITVRQNIFRSPFSGSNNHAVWMHAISGSIKFYSNMCVSRGSQPNVTYWRESSGSPNGTVLVYNNTLYGGARGINTERVAKLKAKNNIVWPSAGGRAFYLAGGRPPAGEINYNVVWAPRAYISNIENTWSGWQSRGYDRNGINIDPKLDDLHAPLSTSPVIDAGLLIPEVSTDILGTSRPQGQAYDSGAHEHE